MATLRKGTRAITGEVASSEHPWDEPLWLDPGTDPARAVRLERRSIEGGGGRVPWLRGELEWSDDAGPHRVRIELPERLRPDDRPDLPPRQRTEARREALRAFGDAIAERCQERSLTLGSVKSLPLLATAGLGDALRITPLDTLLERRLGILSDLCTRPRSSLREETAILPVGRVRRPARDAIAHLQRHTEHAGHDGLRVYPERILASLNEEDLDLYENRVLVTLLKRLRDRATRRLARVDLALSSLVELQSDLDAAKACGQYRRAGRLLKWLEKDGDLATHRVSGEASRTALRTQARSLTACLTSPMALTLRDRPPVMAPLRETNILTFDTKFHAVWELWEALEIEERAHRRPLDAVRDDPDGVWSDYAYLLLLRVLLDAGFVALSDTTLVLSVQPNGADAVLERSAPTGTWRATVRRKLAGPRESPVLQLEIDRRRPQQVLLKPGLRIAGQAVANHVQPSPPVRIRFAPTFMKGDRALIDGNVPGDGAVVWLHPQLPTESDPDSNYSSLLARGSCGLTHDGSRRVPPAVAIAPWSAASGDRLGRLIRALTVGVALSQGEPLDSCPACGAVARAGTRPGDGMCTDADCGAEWGSRPCSCGQRVPKLVPHLPNERALEELVYFAEGPRDRVVLQDRIAGPDLLAEWCVEEIGSQRMICPACGRCANPRPGCARCTSVPA